MLANLAHPGDTLATPRPGGMPAPAIPEYLRLNYWWAYVHPTAVKLFERGWLVNLILWGNYPQLSAAALAALGAARDGRTLQVACVYGDLTPRLAARVGHEGGSLDVVDVLPVQLDNLRKKLPAATAVRLLEQDSSDLALPDATDDRALLFFLLHEQPADIRRRTVLETLRVVKPGGRIILVNHLYSEVGFAAALERWAAEKTRSLGLRPEFPFARLQAWAQSNANANLIERRKVAPFGIYTLVCFERTRDSAVTALS